MSERMQRIAPADWEEAKKKAESLAERGFIFRGQRSAAWPLRSTLERKAPKDRRSVEYYLLERFQRAAPVYLQPQCVPHDGDDLAWLGLMQHYGAPTRLVDFTQSAYVAFYFALEEKATEEAGGDPSDLGGHHAIWAVDVVRVQEAMTPEIASRFNVQHQQAKSQQWVGQLGLVQQFRRLKEEMPGLLITEPWKPDQRQSAQQAVFVFPTSVSNTFEECLSALPESNLMGRTWYR